MATVKALYDYSYDYEGTNITIRIGEAFQLLAKANNDWWHVRRWTDGIAQDLYVPAVYVKEEEQTTQPENPTYENVADIIKKMKEKREKKVNGSSSSPRRVLYQKQLGHHRSKISSCLTRPNTQDLHVPPNRHQNTNRKNTNLQIYLLRIMN